MSTEGVPAERLRAYLRDLRPEAQTLLVTELERGALRGADVPGADFILQALRPVLRQSRQPAPRVNNPARMFFRPLEPFLVDVGSGRSLSGRLERSSLEHLWNWIRRDALPAQAAAYTERISAALLASDEAAAVRLADAFQDEAVRVIGDWLAQAQADERVSRRLGFQVGTPRSLEELSTLHRVLTQRAPLGEFAARLPLTIRNPSNEQAENILGLLRQYFGDKADALPPALIVVMDRLGAFWHLIRLAIRAAESDAAERVAHTPYAAAVDIVLAEFGRRIAELRLHLTAADFVQSVADLRDLHDASRALRTELDLSGDSPWSRELAAMRATISDLLQAEIENLRGQVRRLLRPRGLREIDGASALDATEVAEAEGRIALADACRRYAAELAVNTVAERVHSELKNYLDTATPGLLDALRSMAPSERAFRQSQADAAVRFAGKLHGAEYAALLLKAAGVAASDRPAAKA